ncbi:hypothetical protein [Gynuella sp.]|uniref:hypothetical protein n=1 Tax=Gynuella sp. TaxID=2969146 RepID=UPI003D101F00
MKNKSQLLKTVEYELTKKDFFNSNSCEITLVYVPQIQLSPYVAALLRNLRNKLSGVYLIIHPESNLMSRKLLEYSNVCFGLHLKYFNESESFLNEFLYFLEQRQKKVSCIICHSFSSGTNANIVNYFVKKSQSDFKFFFYSDGSRNNAESEFDPEQIFLLNNAVRSRHKTYLIEFGFSNNKGQDNLEHIQIGYEWLDLAYLCCDLNIRMSHNLTIAESPTFLKDSIIILSRYWGRKPYFFESEDKLKKCFESSIEKVGKNKSYLIFREDNRSTLDTAAVLKNLEDTRLFKQALPIDEIITIENTELKDILFELILLNRPDLFSHVESFYSFDSSFPLIFISEELRSCLSPNVQITVGFDIDSIKKFGTGDCYSVMKTRTCTVIANILELGIFKVSDSLGPVTIDSFNTGSLIRNIGERLEINGGYYWLHREN